MEVIGRIIFRPGFADAINKFGAFVNIPNLQLDSDEFVYIRVEDISIIPILSGSLGNRVNHVTLWSDIPQYPSFDTGHTSSLSQCKRGQCRQLLQLHRVSNIGAQNAVTSSYRFYGVDRYPRVPIKTRVNMIQGKYINMGLEYCDGTPIGAGAIQGTAETQITLVVYK